MGIEIKVICDKCGAEEVTYHRDEIPYGWMPIYHKLDTWYICAKCSQKYYAFKEQQEEQIKQFIKG